MNRSTQKKLLTRSSNTQRSNQKQTIQPNPGQVNNSIHTSSSQFSKKQQEPKQQKSIFYSQLSIQTHDKDVPLVKILKVNQQLQNKFIYHSTSIQKLTQILRIRSLNKGFRVLVNNLVKVQRNQLKTRKLFNILNVIRKRKLEESLLKIVVQKNKIKVKQKAFIVMSRLILSKINSNYLYFIKNLHQKKLIKILLNKSQQDEQVKIKLNLQIFKQLVFSKQFISKCKPLMKDNSNNKTWLQNQLTRQNFTANLQSQLERYEKIRQNVDNKNPNNQSYANLNQSNNKKSSVISRRKQTSQTQFYQNQVVLLAIKSFNLSLIDTKSLYQQKIQHLHEQIQQLRSQQRYLILQNQLKDIQFSKKSYENLINQFYNKADEQIRKISSQIKDQQTFRRLKPKLLPVLLSQKSKYQKAYQKLQKSITNNKRQFQQYSSKLYQTRCFTLDLSIMIINQENEIQEKVIQIDRYQNIYKFVLSNMTELVLICENQTKMKQHIERLRKIKESQEEKEPSLALINIMQKFQQLTKKVRISMQDKKVTQTVTKISAQKQQKKSIEPFQRQTSAKKSALQQTNKKAIITGQSNTKIKKQNNLQNEIINPQQDYSKILQQSIQRCILDYIKSVNKKYEQDWLAITFQNQLLKKNLLPQSKGRNNPLIKNIQINNFINLVNSQVVTLVKNLKQTIKLSQYASLQKAQVVEMVRMFYQLILCKQTNSKQIGQYNEMNKKWIQYCKTKISSSSSTNNEQKTAIINIFNEILMIFKQMTTKTNNQPQQNFSQQLKKILKQKLQFQRQYHQIDRKYLIKEEQFKLVEKQNKQYQKRNLQMEKDLLTSKQQSKLFTQKSQRYEQTISKLKQQLELYMNTTKTETQQNNKLTKELNKSKNTINSLNDQIQRYKIRQQNRAKGTSQQKTNKKSTYTERQYTKMQTQLKYKISSMEQDLQQTQNQRCLIQNQRIQLSSIVKDLQRTIQQSKFQMKKYLSQIERLKAQNIKWISIQQAYQLQIEKLEKQNSQLNQKIKLLDSEIQTYRRQAVNYQQTLTTLKYQAQITHKNNANQTINLHEQLQKKNKLIHSLNEELNQKNKKIYQIQTQYLKKYHQYKQCFQQQINKMKQFHASQIRQIENGFDRQTKLYQQKISTLHTQINNFKIQRQTTLIHHYQPNDSQQSQSKQYFDPQKQIQSLKRFIQTLKRQNQNLQNKYTKLKKQFYSDDVSTVYSSKSNQLKNNQSTSYYEKIIHDLKIQNDGLYDQINILTHNKNSSIQNNQTQNVQENSNYETFWVAEIKKKQSTLLEQDKQIIELKQKINELENISSNNLNVENYGQYNSNQTININQFMSLQQKLLQLKTQQNKHQEQNQERIHILQLNLNNLQIQNRDLKLLLQQQKQKPYKQSENLVTFNYSQILLATKQVKQLFTSFIQATNSILYKLDRTSQIYLGLQQNINSNNMSQQYYKQQSQRAYRSILSLVEQFKTVIQNNHQTLKSIYQDLVCHPYTKNALELQYLKQLTYNIIRSFSSNFKDPSTMNLAQEFLQQQIDGIFEFNIITKQKVKPIEEIFVNVEQFIISKLDLSLQSYKKQLHIKAIQLDYLREKFNIMVDKELLAENFLINKFPVQNHCLPQRDLHSQTAIIHHNYQYNPNNFLQQPYYQNLAKNQSNIAKNISSHHNLVQYDNDNENVQNNSHQVIRPFSANWVSKTASNYQYRPVTYADERYNDFSNVMRQNDRQKIVFRSSMQQQRDQNYSFQSDRYS